MGIYFDRRRLAKASARKRYKPCSGSYTKRRILKTLQVTVADAALLPISAKKACLCALFNLWRGILQWSPRNGILMSVWTSWRMLLNWLGFEFDRIRTYSGSVSSVLGKGSSDIDLAW